MFKNIGSKIKTTAIVVTILGIIGSVIGGIVVMAANTYRNPTILIGILIIVLGCLGSWLGSFVLYGFGQLIEDLGECKNHLRFLANSNSGLTGTVRKQGSVSASTPPENNKSKDTPTSCPTVQTSPVSSGYPWICDKCGARNAASATVCRDCGEQHITVAKTPHVVPASPVSQPAKATPYSEWKCPKCGYLNPAGQLSCKSCGEYI